MSQYRDFQGKTLDDAIQEACEYFGVAREKLEIEIVNDAKSGIFGLVGAKKASIKACRVTIEEAVSSAMVSEKAPRIGEQPDGSANAAGSAAKAASFPGKALKPKLPEPVAAPKSSQETAPREGEIASREPRQATQPRAGKKTAQRQQAQAGRRPRSVRPGREAERPGQESRTPSPFAEFSADSVEALHDSMRGEDLPEYDLRNCDPAVLSAILQETVLRLVQPIVGDVPCKVDIGNGRVRLSLDCGDASGLLVGREGQTLASVQYLASRIVARKIGGSLRLQIDAGNYRERQDDRLKELALHLAEKVKQTGRPQSTRPLSAYQRRLVHLALDGDTAVPTRSNGDGAQRTVVLFLKNTQEEQPRRLPRVPA